MNSRSKVFLVILNLILIFFLLRLFTLQVIENKKYTKLSSDNAARNTPILAPRGIVFDRSGKVLLKNKPVFMLYVLPHLLPENPIPVFERLSSIVGISSAQIEERFKERKTQIFEGVLIESDIPIAKVARIEEERNNLPGIEVICYPLRAYPYKRVAAHVLGYVGEIEQNELVDLKDEGYRLGDLVGKDGVEKFYDKYLRGQSGGKKIEVDAQGNPVRVLEIVDPTPGNNVYLTIDLEMQQKVDEILGNKEGAVVVLNPNNGDVLAMSSHPDYDATHVWSEIDQRNHPFMNRALATYPPGSTFKVVTLAAALQESLTQPTEIFTCLGYYKLGQRIAKCWKAVGHGRVSPIEGLVWSCDVVFYELGKRMGPDILNKYAAMFGLGQRTNIDLPQEKKGFIPNSAWKKARFGENWYDGDSINMGIGQGFIQVTPIQMACLYGEIATGKRYKPRVVSKVVDKDDKIIFENKSEIVDKLNINPMNLALIKNALKDVVLRGTGIAAFIPGCEASGKTGTAENPGLAHAWFMCYAPSDTPEIVIVAFVAHGEHGDRVTANIARDILKWYKENRLIHKSPERARPDQFIMHGNYKEYLHKITLDSN